MRLSKTYKLCISAVCLAIGFVLPFLTGQIRTVGNMLLPMHLPVMLCGFLCGSPWGAVVGFVLPFLRCFTVGMPTLPLAIAMSLELASYGALTGLFYKIFPKKVGYFYLSLILSMLGGRVVWAFGRMMVSGLFQVKFSFEIFLASGFATAFPGMILQIILVPALFYAVRRAVFRYQNKKQH